jgi:hypothetical protein
LLTLNAPQVAFPDTGSVRDDLREHLRRSCRFSTGPDARILRALIAELQHDPQLAEDFRTRFWDERRREGQRVIERGIERGELLPDLDVTLVLDVLYAPVYLRQLIGHAELGDAFSDALVQSVFDGIARRR